MSENNEPEWAVASIRFVVGFGNYIDVYARNENNKLSK